MTTSVGQVLQRARTQRGIDLNEVERVTKVRVKFLRAMEEDRWDKLPEPAHARSFLDTYARYLDLDPEPLVEEYDDGRAGNANGAKPIPSGTIRPSGVRSSRRGVRLLVLLGAGLAALVILGVVIAGNLGGPGGGGSAKHHAVKAQKPAGATATGQPVPGSQVSLNLRSTDAVWVCLVDNDHRALVAETLSAGETRGPFDGRSFEVTFGNGSVQMTVNGHPAKVPALAEPLGYRITPESIRPLDSGARPTCT